jgi:hypothetical protein
MMNPWYSSMEIARCPHDYWEYGPGRHWCSRCDLWHTENHERDENKRNCDGKQFATTPSIHKVSKAREEMAVGLMKLARELAALIHKSPHDLELRLMLAETIDLIDQNGIPLTNPKDVI